MKVLVLGASGKLGRKILSHLRDSGFDVAGTYYSNLAISYIDQKANLEQTDATNIGRLYRLFNRTRPDIIIDAIGNPDPDWCEVNKDAALDVNTFTARNIATVCYPKKLVFISTDYVFDGLNNPYKEEDEPRPVNHYGLTKYLGELYVRRLSHEFLILRLPLLYDRKYILEMTERIKEGIINTDHVLIKHPTWVGDVAKAIEALIEKDVCGIYHMGNKGNATRYEWALKVADFFHLGKNKVAAGGRSYLAKRPLNVELDTSKIKGLGISCKKVDEVMKELF